MDVHRQRAGAAPGRLRVLPTPMISLLLLFFLLMMFLSVAGAISRAGRRRRMGSRSTMAEV